MNMKAMFSLMIMVPFIGLPLWAQEGGDQEARETVQEETVQEPTGAATIDEGAGKLLRAIRLPEAAEQAREEGVPAEEVKKVLEAARGRDLPAGETEAIMVEETRAVRDNGQIDNFGSFVKSKLDEGLRGRDLSDAIRAEHAARGKGRGHGNSDKAGAGRSGGPDRDEATGERGNQGRNQGKEKQPGAMGERKGRHEDDVIEREGAARGKKMKSEKTDGQRGKKDEDEDDLDSDD